MLLVEGWERQTVGCNIFWSHRRISLTSHVAFKITSEFGCHDMVVDQRPINFSAR